MNSVVMPKATAVWLVENTSLTFKQISDFCGMHELEVQALANGSIHPSMRGYNPVAEGLLTIEDIKRCEENSALDLVTNDDDLVAKAKTKVKKYTPLSKRGDRPAAIAWLVKHYPELSDNQIIKLVRTTRPTIITIRNKEHWNMENIKPQNPVHLGLCSHVDLEKAIKKAENRRITGKFDGQD